MTTEHATSAPVADVPSSGGTSRRQLLAGGATIAAAVALTSACGSASGSGGGDGGAVQTPSGGGTTVRTGDVPVNGGLILQDKQIVVTQPQAGTYKAFGALCTHEGCLVTSVANNSIQCPCHGATFSATDGAVQGGPAREPLPSVPLTVSGSTITLT
jgi:Rieske Fe-S protein